MLQSLKALRHANIEAADGLVGTLDRILIDIDHWAIRYLVVDAGGWWDQHEVLLSPQAVRGGGPPDRTLRLSLTRAQVKSGPGAMLRAPLLPPAVPAGIAGIDDARQASSGGAAVLEDARGDLGLADSQDILGTHLHASDGDIGHVEDFLLDVDTWSLRYLVVDTSNWWIGKQVLISPDWIDRFEWPGGKLHVGLDRASVKGAPEYDGTTPPGRETEVALFHHHRRPPYWVE
jgi:hypothetical protein